MKIKQKIKAYLYPNHPISEDLIDYQTTLIQINTHYKKIKNLLDSTLKNQIVDLKNRAKNGNLDEILVEFYAIIKVVCHRQLGLLPYDVQMIGAIALHQGNLIEMQTGEGKTLSAVFPTALNAITGNGVHVMTFNDYLAQRDALTMKPVYDFLGLSVGYIQENQSKKEKRAAYHCDITYATAKSIGFDYLRNFMEYDAKKTVMRAFNFVIVDEADAILIDEARNPLVLAGDMEIEELDYFQIAAMVQGLTENDDFKINTNAKNAYFTEKGLEYCESFFNIENITAETHLYAALNLALHAHLFLTKDVDYIVIDRQILLIDEFTGRAVAGRKWRSGLQTAIEAKEKISIQIEGRVLNSITLQHLLQKYPKISGMTATAQSAAEEFLDFYDLKTVVIPTNKPCLRIDHQDKIFTTKQGKYTAIIKEVKRVHARKQPILIGTLTVKESEFLGNLLKKAGIKATILNAKNDELEAQIIANAGRLSAVTISTNMAGRGTDIKLGNGNKTEYETVLRLGGLYVLGTNRHESLRIDRQLKGRAARQGDAGETRFFISFDDDLMMKYRLDELLPKAFRGMKTEVEITNKKVLKAIDRTQISAENCLFDVRKMLCEYSDFAEKQCQIIQNERSKVLEHKQFLNDLIGKEQANKFDPSFEQKLKIVVLYQYDQYLAKHLEKLSIIRENISAVRLGGQHPLRVFRERAHESFQELCQILDQVIERKIKQLLINPTLTLEELEIHPPTSTWTYVTSDNPFDNQLMIMLLQNGNIGMMVDPFSGALLLMKVIYDKINYYLQKRKKVDH